MLMKSSLQNKSKRTVTIRHASKLRLSAQCLQPKPGKAYHLRWRRYAAGGSTLIELVIASACATMLLAGLASSIFISSRAFDEHGAETAKTRAARSVVNEILADMQYAIRFSERTGNAVAFTIPDRDGDMVPESVRYAWSGIVGAPLTKELNGSPPAVLLSSVQNLDLSFLTRTIGPPPPPPIVESAEQLLIFHDSAPGATIKTVNINTNNSCAQYFKPTLPGNAVSWKVTRVQIIAESHGAPTGTLNVRIDSATAFQEPDAIIEGQFVQESLLAGTGAWTEVAFSAVEGLDPAKGLCLVISANSNGVAGCITYEEGGSPMTSNTSYMSTMTGGTSWTAPEETKDLRFKVYGTISIPE